MNKLIALFLSLSLFLTPAKTIKAHQYTIYIPKNPLNIIVYYHCNGTLPHANEKSKRPFNFQEGIAQLIFKQNPDSIVVVTYQYSEKLVKQIDKLAKKYNIKDIVISGWSAGGNNAIRAAATLTNKDRYVQLLLVDCNDTNQVPMKYIRTLKKAGIEINYTSNLINRNKNKVLSNIRSEKIPIHYYKLKIPEDYSGSRHIYCRNCSINYNLYGYLLGDIELNKHYKYGYFDYNKNSIKFPR